jgi:hypothetical protein
VVVDEFDIFRTSISPDEADSPLRVDPDAVLPSAVTHQLLQPISRRNPKILHVLGGVDQLELPQGRSLHCSINALNELLMPDTLGVFAAERSDHATSV